MRIECKTAVEKALGREISQAEERGLEDKLVDTMRRLASKDPNAWMRMPKAERLRQAADMAAKDLEQAAELKERRAALTVEATARLLPAVERAGKDGFGVIQQQLEQVDVLIKGIRQQYFTGALDAIDLALRKGTGSPISNVARNLAQMEDPANALALVREVFTKADGSTGNAAAQRAARAWLDTAEAMRERFNAAGGDVRKLSYGYLPQPHDGAAVREAGIERWVRDVLPLVDRNRYTNPDGRPMNDADLAQMLEEAWRTIGSDGWSAIEPGVFRGEGSLANAGSQARVIHFKDADSYVAYLGKYGESGSVFDALSGHIGWMSSNIGLVESMGPNPKAMFRLLNDTAKQAGGTDRVMGLTNTEDMFRTLTGEVNNPQSQTAARIWQGLRSIQVVGKLQQATLSAITDLPSYMVTLAYHRLPMMTGVTNLVRAFGPESRVYAERAGLIAESVISDMNRWGGESVGHGWTGRLASATMKVSLMNAWTDAIRRAFSVTMMGGMARISRTPWAELEAGDRTRLERKGWTQDEWAVLQEVEPETWRNTPMLTPAAIQKAEGVDAGLRDRVISRLLGTIVDESEYASLGPDLRTRTLQTGGLQRGSGTGEIWRSAMLLKGFSFAMISRHWRRALSEDMSPAGRLAYGSALFFSMTLMGGVALQLKDLAAGKDPRDMTGSQGDDPAKLAKFWMAAFSQGGGAGFLGDLLLLGEGRAGQSGASAAIGGVVGPVFGSGFEAIYDLGADNLRQAAEGKDTHFGAEAWRWTRSHLPFINLWYARTAIDRAFLDQAQEALSPGYLERVKAHAERTWGTEYFWEPNDTGLLTGDMSSPERGPALERAIGE